MDYWKHVLWSNETKINISGSDGVKRVLRQLGEEYKDWYVYTCEEFVFMSEATAVEQNDSDRTKNTDNNKNNKKKGK